MGNRKLMSAAPPIRVNNQLMVILVGGGGDKRGGRLWGIGRQKRVKVKAIWWRHLSSTKSLPYLPSVHPRAAKGPEPTPHASWIFGCPVSSMISSCSGPNQRGD
jgi:hypothetical protein